MVNAWIDDVAEENVDAQIAADKKAAKKIERESHKLEKRLCRNVGQAIVDYNMI